jgi:hypothetical protein
MAKAMRAAFRDTRPRAERVPYTPFSLVGIAAKLARDTRRAMNPNKKT